MTNDEIDQALANEISAYVNMRKEDKEEKYLKAKAEKNKQGVVTNGAINERLLLVVKKFSQDKKLIEAIEKSKKTKEQTSLEFQQKKYCSLISLMSDDAFNQELFDLKNEYSEFVIAKTNEHETVTWLNQWTNKAVDISFATHVGKLTHSGSKSSSILDASCRNAAKMKRNPAPPVPISSCIRTTLPRNREAFRASSLFG